MYPVTGNRKVWRFQTGVFQGVWQTDHSFSIDYVRIIAVNVGMSV